MTMSTTQTEEQKAWDDFLAGTLSAEAAKAIWTRLRGAGVADSLLRSAIEARNAGLASGASWAKPATYRTAQPVESSSFLPGDPTTALGEIDPFAAYSRLGELPAQGRSTFQEWQARQFDPAYSVYQAQSALSPAGQAVTPWNEYLQGTPLSVAGIRGQAANLFQQARGGDQGQFLGQMKGTAENRWVGEPLQELLEAALMSRYAAPVARTMGGWIPGLATEYQAETLGTGKKLMDFLNERLRLR